jgi:Domain of unknown function (DUF4602)
MKTTQQIKDSATYSAINSQKRRQVQVVSCPSAFPISATIKKSNPDSASHRKRPRGGDGSNNKASSSASSSSLSLKPSIKSSTKLLDWHETVKEVRAYGATAFARKEKRNFEDEQYFQLTGRHRKKQKVPLPIVRGIRKAAEKREEKLRLEAQQAGIVLPKKSSSSSSSAKQNGKAYQKYQQDGPAPSIGFTKNGVYRVPKEKLPKGKQRR